MLLFIIHILYTILYYIKKLLFLVQHIIVLKDMLKEFHFMGKLKLFKKTY